MTRMAASVSNGVKSRRAFIAGVNFDDPAAPLEKSKANADAVQARTASVYNVSRADGNLLASFRAFCAELQREHDADLHSIGKYVPSGRAPNGIFAYFCCHGTSDGTDIVLHDGHEGLPVSYVLGELAKYSCLKLLVFDCCRTRPNRGRDPTVRSIQEIDSIARHLRDTPNFMLAFSTSDGQYSGEGASLSDAKLGRFAAALDVEFDLAASAEPIELLLLNVRYRIEVETRGRQAPEIATSEVLSLEFHVGPLGRSKRIKRMPTAKEKLDTATAQMESARETVRRGDNGIQFIATAIFSGSWETLAFTEFLAEEHSGSGKKNLLQDAASTKLKKKAQELAMKAFSDAKQSGRTVFEEGDQVMFADIPQEFDQVLYYRWRMEPSRHFIFFSGGIGPQIKAQQFGTFSKKELDSKGGVLSKALNDFAVAFDDYNRSG